LQEALDTLTNQLTAVKQRQPLSHATRLNKRVEMMMRGEIEEKRSVERLMWTCSSSSPKKVKMSKI